jgi:hypothetical protein
MNTNKVAEKKKRWAETPASVGGAFALIAAFAPLVHPFLFFILSPPLLFAAFVLAIVSLVRGRVTGGVCLLVGLFPALMMAFGTLTERDKLLNHQPATVLQPVTSKQSSTAAVEATQPSPLDSHHAVEATPQPQFITTTQSVSFAVSYGNIQLPSGTRLDFVSKDGADIHIRYQGVEYVIPISATDLK